MRDCYAGEDAIKEKTTEYLPATEGMTEDGLHNGGDGAKEWALNGGIPSNTAALSDAAVVAKVPQFKLLSEAMPYRHITPITTVSDQFVTAMVDAASAAIAGSKTPKEALDAAAKVIEAALKDGGYKQ